HLREIPQAELVPEPPQDDEQHEVGRVLEVVVGGARTLVADPAAAAAPEGAIAERGAARLLGGRGRGTVGAGHGLLLHATANTATLPECGRSHQARLTSDASLHPGTERLPETRHWRKGI